METSILDIVSLIEKNPLIKLNKNYQNKFIEKIQSTFTETQQNLFVGSFYCYLNYNDTDFIVNLDDVWKWLGFSRKDDCKTLLKKNFVEEIDYVVDFSFSMTMCIAKHRSIIMSITTFKKLCMKAETKEADEVLYYFIKLEKILREVADEESADLGRKLFIENEWVCNFNSC